MPAWLGGMVVWTAMGIVLAGCAPGKSDATATTIALKRGACYGTCPVYTIEIQGDGMVTYDGAPSAMGGGTATLGRQTGRADQQGIDTLLAMVRAMDFYHLADRYAAPVSDLPTNIVTVSIDGRTKTVIDYGGMRAGMPKAVRDLEAKIDEVAGTAQWLHPPAETGQETTGR
ncbi:DUF6438 domain-containing protein [Azospirillum sp. B4]|uniref:DUF6438 domain-containing protein n=1 Tax=Azospirillum sp. B4 TaxID=95605 RepID=UPI00131ED30C|nr:DUF6438 domain-containing protein [Azospirillum sp. B4]